MKRLVFLASVFLFLLSPASQSRQTRASLHDWVTKQTAAADLDVSLVPNKKSYKPSDRIELEVKLINNNAVKDIFVYGTLEFGYRGSFMLYRRDARGNEVPTRMIDEALELRPKPDDSAAFVKLLPFHFLGTTYRSSIHLLNLQKPGRYKLWVEYHSPISSSQVNFTPFFGKEIGLIKSNVVWIRVVP